MESCCTKDLSVRAFDAEKLLHSRIVKKFSDFCKVRTFSDLKARFYWETNYLQIIDTL